MEFADDGPPVMETPGLTPVERSAKNNRMRGR